MPRKFSEGHRKKISLAMIGNKHNLGKHHSEETRHKISLANKGKLTGIKRGPMSEETKLKISLGRLGQDNPAWVGDSVKYSSLHQWVRRHLPQPELCEFCNQKPPEDLANMTGIYNREFKNWKYLCTRCHLYHDGVITNNLMYQKESLK